jgi:hypothetical protein
MDDKGKGDLVPLTETPSACHASVDENNVESWPGGAGPT